MSPLAAHPALVRALLASLGLIQALDGLYALLAPRGFYEDFPFGRGWVAAYPEYSEHLVRDIGGLFLATGVLLLIAAIWLERHVVIAALTAWLLFAVPHTTYHLLELEALDAGDAVANAIALAATVVLPVWMLAAVARGARPRPPVAAPASDRARIALPERPRGLAARFAYRFSRRRFGTVLDPVKAYAHAPLAATGYGTLELLTERSRHAPERLKQLTVMRTAMLCGCEWCIDFGTAEMLAGGITEDELKELPTYRDSARFSALDKLALDYATAMTRTPVDVPDELVARLRDQLGDPALVELTHMIALENLRARFNWALGIGAQGFSDGAVLCVVPPKDAGSATAAPA